MELSITGILRVTIQTLVRQEIGWYQPIMPEDPYAYIMAAYEVPPSPDYIPGPEVPPSPDYIPGPEVPPSPDYIPGPEEDEILPAEEQPLPAAAASPTVDSPGYVPESDPEEEPEEDDEDTEEDPADYPADGDDDEDEDEDEDDDEEEEEEHPAPADSVLSVHRRGAAFCFSHPLSNEAPEEVQQPVLLGRIRPTIARDDPYSIAREDLYGFVDMVDVSHGTVRRDTSMYGIMEDAQDDRSQLRGRVNLLYKDRLVHRRLAVMIERKAKIALAHSALISELQSEDHMRQRVISELLASYHKRQVQLTKTLRLLKGLQTQMVELQRQHGPAKGPVQPNAPGELADYIDLLFCLATQYRSFVQVQPVTDTHTTTSITNAQLQALIDEGVTAALTARDVTRNNDDSHTSGIGTRRPVQVARECTYPDFLKYQPLNFKGTKGVVGLTQWFEKIKSVYSISNCTVAYQVKFSMCTMQGNALTWWNSHVKTTTPEAAHAMPWRTLKKMMTDKYCPRGKIKKLEFKM
ncbi:hypothetical protein Tco_0788132 [Tanacetum coccineum]